MPGLNGPYVIFQLKVFLFETSSCYSQAGLELNCVAEDDFELLISCLYLLYWDRHALPCLVLCSAGG